MNEELKNILEKVRLLYLKYGIKSITMDDVSRELGISKKTLYQYVCDKTDLVQKVLELEMNHRQCEYDSIYDEKKSAIEELIDVHRFVFKNLQKQNPSTEYDLKKYYPDLYKKFNEDRRKKVSETIKRNLIRGKEQGLYRADLNVDIITDITVVRSNISTGDDDFMKIELAAPEFFTEVMIYHIRGISNEKGLKVLAEQMERLKNPVVL